MTTLGINIFLKQFTNNTEAIDILKQGNTKRISLDKMKAFENILPAQSMVRTIMKIYIAIYVCIYHMHYISHLHITHTHMHAQAYTCMDAHAQILSSLIEQTNCDFTAPPHCSQLLKLLKILH